MRRNVIHVVMACMEYEGSNTVRAFNDKGKAEAFSEKCQAYQSKKPEYIEGEDATQNDAAYEVWEAKLIRWEKRHPAGKENASCDSFPVWTVPLGD